MKRNDFQVNVERLENLITERTKALVINSPNNPTGNCLTTETMREIARIAEAYDLIVISDEIYTAYSYQHPFVPFASLPGMAFGACGEGYLRMRSCHGRQGRHRRSLCADRAHGAVWKIMQP